MNARERLLATVRHTPIECVWAEEDPCDSDKLQIVRADLVERNGLLTFDNVTVGETVESKQGGVEALVAYLEFVTRRDQRVLLKPGVVRASRQSQDAFAASILVALAATFSINLGAPARPSFVDARDQT